MKLSPIAKNRIRFGLDIALVAHQAITIVTVVVAAITALALVFQPAEWPNSIPVFVVAIWAVTTHRKMRKASREGHGP